MPGLPWWQVTGSLNLSGLRLHNRHVPRLQLFTGVTVLSLADNRISGLSDLALGYMVSLQELDLQNNSLRWVSRPGSCPRSSSTHQRTY